MRLHIIRSLLMVCLTVLPASGQTDPVPNEDNCRTAISIGLEQLRQIPPDINQRDDRDRRKLLEEMERLVEENRRRGVSECRTWTEMMGKAFNQ